MKSLKQLLGGSSFLEITKNNPKSLAAETQIHGNYQLTIHGTGFLEIIPNNSLNIATIISTAIHGNETAPIEICDEIIQEVISGKLELKYPTLFILGNPPGMNAAKRFVDYNLNRLFDGNHKNIDPCYETQRAREIEEVVHDFYQRHNTDEKRHYDLHTAIKPSKHEKFAIYPFSPNKERSIEQMNIMGLLGANVILYSTSKSTTFSYHTSANYNAHSFTVELGKVHPFGQNPIENFKKTRENLKKFLNGTLEIGHKLSNDIIAYQVHHSVIKETEEFDFYFPDNTENFTLFKKGEKIYKDRDTEYIADCDVRVIFPNKNVINGQRAALLVVEV
jgi:succinylglutamate desuccinylase